MEKMLLCSDGDAFHLLEQLEHILDCDPLIDEVGFIHPSQLLTLNEVPDAAFLSPGKQEADMRMSSEPSVANQEGRYTFFWNRDHKLGISTACLLPLYKAAKCKFMEALLIYKMNSKFSLKNDNTANSFLFSEIENEVIKLSKCLLLLSSDFGTAWNARKLIISKREEFSFSDELHMSSLVLSFAPKSENAWSYRRWIIKRIIGRCAILKKILKEESKLVEKIAEKSKMNYRAWYHRCWLISYMTAEQALQELDATRNWAALHVADNSCFHYRQKLMLRMMGNNNMNHEDLVAYSTEFESLQQLWKNELDWNQVLIRHYIGREALWLHRRFLSVHWVKRFGAGQNAVWTSPNEKGNSTNHISVFIGNELNLLQDCLRISNSEFEDVQSQAIHSASYILWLSSMCTRQCISITPSPPPETSWPSDIGLNEKLRGDALRTLLIKLSPERTKLWQFLLSNLLLSETEG